MIVVLFRLMIVSYLSSRRPMVLLRSFGTIRPQQGEKACPIKYRVACRQMQLEPIVIATNLAPTTRTVIIHRGCSFAPRPLLRQGIDHFPALPLRTIFGGGPFTQP